MDRTHGAVQRIYRRRNVRLITDSPTSFHMDSPTDKSCGLRTPDVGPLQGAKNIAQSKEYCLELE